jgi:RNA polymerase II-associated factor 1
MMLPDHPMPIDPADRPLLKPLTVLGKAGANVSFLRRTEYITSHRNAKDDGGGVLRASSALRPSRPRPTPKGLEPGKNTPEAMLRAIERSFNLAYPHDAPKGPDGRPRGPEIPRNERDAWDKPKHPTQPDLELLDSYPIIPDIAALGDSGVYMQLKFNKNPSGNDNVYDEGLDVALLQPQPPTAAQEQKYREEEAQYKKDPVNYPKPTYFTNFSLFLPAEDASISVSKIKRKFSMYAVDRDDDGLYTHHPGVDDGVADPCFRFNHSRFFETYTQSGHSENPWNDSLGIALCDGENRGLKAAFAYPIAQKTTIRPDRSKIKKQKDPYMQDEPAEGEDEMVDALDVEVRDLLPEEKEKLLVHARTLDPTIPG